MFFHARVLGNTLHWTKAWKWAIFPMKGCSALTQRFFGYPSNGGDNHRFSRAWRHLRKIQRHLLLWSEINRTSSWIQKTSRSFYLPKCFYYILITHKIVLIENGRLHKCTLLTVLLNKVIDAIQYQITGSTSSPPLSCQINWETVRLLGKNGHF